jgi:hypothetical protein
MYWQSIFPLVSISMLLPADGQRQQQMQEQGRNARELLMAAAAAVD